MGALAIVVRHNLKLGPCMGLCCTPAMLSSRGGHAGEVCKRLHAAGVRGRMLTLKLKRRKAGAPEPPKFMGHGSCDNLSRSLTLPRFTASEREVAVAARSLLRTLRVPAPEIRGIGIAVWPASAWRAA